MTSDNYRVEQSQLIKMKELIKKFNEGEIYLSSFISGMEFLFHAMEEVDESWDELFLEEITNLESVHSGVPPTVSEEIVNKIVAEAAVALETLVDKRLCD